MAKKNVGIWLRVSTKMQVDDSDSLEHHEARARMYAEAKNWNVKEVYRLEGISGKDVMEHPETHRMISDIQTGKISGLIFSKISRLARSTKQLLEFSELFEKNKADLISIYENIDTSSPAGKLFFTLICAMAQWEREEIASRVKASVEVRAKMGKRLGGQAQFGFQWKGEELILNKKEAPIRKLMYELFLEYKRLTTVARKLNEMGYRTRTGTKFSKNTIKRWLKDPISKGLRRTNYSQLNSQTKATELKPKEEWYMHNCPQIVSPELWQEVNDILEEQESKRNYPLNKKTHIFSRYIYCHCGSKMNVRSRLTHYKCVNKECNNKIRREDLEKAFKDRLDEFLESKQELKLYFKNSEKNIETKQKELENLKKNLKEVGNKLENILHLHSIGQIPSDAFSEYHAKPYIQSKQLKEQIITLENELLLDVQKKKSMEDVVKDAKDIYAKWDEFDRDRKREIIEIVLESVIIEQDQIVFNLNRLTPYIQSSGFGLNGVRNLFVLSPILPLQLTAPIPKHFRYPKEVLSVGDELRAVRIDRGLTQHQVAKQIGVNKNFISECELQNKTNTIFALHKIYLFLGYIPKTLKLDKNILKDRLFIHRIENGLTYKDFAKEVGLEKSTIIRCEKGKNCNKESITRIKSYIGN